MAGLRRGERAETMNQPSCKCRSCGADIPLADINVSADIALCRACGQTMPFSVIAPIPGAADVDLSRPPKGVTIERDPMKGTSIIYRKIPLAVLFLIPFTAVWSGFSMFGIYGTQIKTGRFDVGSSLFGLPFLLGTVALLALITFLLLGRCRIGFVRGVLEVALEIGPFGWTRRIQCDRGARVSIQTNPNMQVNNAPQRLIHVECKGKTLKFGTMIPEMQKNFIAEAVRRAVADA